MDLTKRPEFAPGRLAQTLADLKALDLKISDLGASARMHEADPKVRALQLDEGRRFIDLAQKLGAPYVRVFGDRVPPGEARTATIPRVIDGLRTLGEHAKGSGVAVIIESHGDFADSPSLAAILEGAAMPNVALLWDAHHTFVLGKEDPASTYARLGLFVRHTHLKDSVPKGADRQYVLTGPGRRAGQGHRGRARPQPLPRLLLLRMGESLASRARGARGRLSALRGRDAAVSLGRRLSCRGTETSPVTPAARPAPGRRVTMLRIFSRGGPVNRRSSWPTTRTNRMAFHAAISPRASARQRQASRSAASSSGRRCTPRRRAGSSARTTRWCSRASASAARATRSSAGSRS